MTVMNMLVGVLCEVISSVAQTEREERDIFMVKEKMGQIVAELDTDCDDRISHKEFMRILHIPDAIRVLKEVGVDPEGLVDFADLFFLEDGKYVSLTFEKF